MKSFFAKAEREGIDKIKEQNSGINSLDYLDTLINALPYPVLVLNDKRQIVFSNTYAIESISAAEFSSFLGKRPGEFLGCIHANDNEGGCGTSRHCKFCGAVNTIIRSQKEDSLVKGDCRIIADKGQNMDFYNFEISAKPFKVNGEKFTIFSLIENTTLRKKEMMERLFFHDIINTAGNLKILSGLAMKSQDEDDRLEKIKMIEMLTSELLDEIKGQKQITQAENGELVLAREHINTIRMLDLLANQYNSSEESQISVEIGKDCEDLDFQSDHGIVSRILRNMVKNAVEASGPGEKVSVSARKMDESIRFSVKNTSVIHQDVQMQIFQKSYSTKSKGRGFGTYSMKLLGENYLRGKVSFISNEKEGTIFIFDLPL